MTNDIDQPDLGAGAWLFRRETVFLRGASALSHLPAGDRPEVAFCGRSNVGKSSLLNALTGRKSLARTSNTPGRTRELNFFKLPDSDAGLYLVDLPGYGYAQAPKTEIAAWTEVMIAYLRGRANLRRAFLLIDARHGLKPNDHEAINHFNDAAVAFQIILTKADKLKPPALQRVIAETSAQLAKSPSAHPRVIATSAAKGVGIDLVRAEIATFLDLTALGYKASH